MADFEFVTKRIAVGAAINDMDDVQQLVDAGVTDVVDCQRERDDTKMFAAHPDITVLWVGVDDDGQPKAPSWFLSVWKIMLSEYANPHCKIYFHCAAGVNRGPSMCFAFLLALGFMPEDAERVIRAVRPQVGLAYKADAIRAATEVGYL